MDKKPDDNGGIFCLSALPWIVIISSWTMFCFCLASVYWQQKGLNGSFAKIEAIMAISVLSVLLPVVLWRIKARWMPWICRVLAKHEQAIDSLTFKNTGAWIMLAAGLWLFCELMIIR